MKKLKRDAEKFDVLELFADMATEHGYDLYDPLALEDFVSRVRASIEESKKSNIAIFGKRIESLFAYVAGALGKVVLLKQEDSGDIYFSGEDLIAPDYRLTFHDNEQLLVEVKNCHHKNPANKYSIKKNYFNKLKNYADINGLDLKFAVYLSSWNLWVLLSIESFEDNKHSYTIDLARAMACSEMAHLGDCMVGTAPDLELHLLADVTEASEIDDSGQAIFTIRDVKIYCAGNEVTDEEEKKIAFYLILFGTWLEKDKEVILRGNTFLGMKFVYSPESQEEPNFAFIGRLSTMVTNGFRNHTVKNGDVVALKLGLDPSVFKVLIPQDYKGQNLPLWRLFIQSNPDFNGVVSAENG
ncbi:MAG: hypothetical protein KJ856_10895 [Gammaproteobacteria bacterium]|nr:hypothetical protein [Gammaproteobacteria bacterium]MBU1479937.1 hypothetical protein [Gammaproteobacteria bacterium]MBU2130926.1 hypothetical protein [Gammaproteobacteria bacterium]MBU2187505.1 hypothetical protein [Gammaproteobacteria bacterium]MBU2420978.1 hypothetical protein [Gammaproteobacteria bacterium]